MRYAVVWLLVCTVWLAGCPSSKDSVPVVDLVPEDQAADGQSGLDTENRQDITGPGDAVPTDSVVPDGGGDLVPADAPDDPDACQPECAGKECGDDGCGGSCGDCGEAATCNEAGTCDPLPCESSLDCPGDLICYKDEGICVDCIGDADCPEGSLCNESHVCYEVVVCESDKDCKEADMVCDKALGICVDCLSDVDCPDGWLCQNATCIEPFCYPGSAGCEGQDVVQCNDEGTEWLYVSTCPEEEFCVDGLCQELVCMPGTVFCEGEVVSQCNEDGSDVIVLEDCGEAGLNCVNGECTDCVPDCVGKECGDDGCGGSCGVCADGVPCVQGQCPTACEMAELLGGGAGCTFFAVDLDNVEGGQYAPIGLMVAAPVGAGDATLAVDVFTNGSAAPVGAAQLQVDSLEVPEGGYKLFLLPDGHDLDNTMSNGDSFRIVSSVPVTAYQFNPLNGNNIFTNDASMLLPVHMAGTNYVGLSWPQRTSGYTLRGNLTAVAVSPGLTKISIKAGASVMPGGEIPALSAGETFQLEVPQGTAINLATGGNQQGTDLTGTVISANHPIAVFGAHECANVPLGTNYCDHLEQQLLPVTGWGTTYVADAFAPRNASQKDIWRIVAALDDTLVVANPLVGGPWELNAGEWVEVSTGSSFVIDADKPVQVGHYLQGSNYTGFSTSPLCTGSGIGDPAFTILQPVTGYTNATTVLTPEGYDLDYLNVVVPLGGGSASIDGQPVTGTAIEVGDYALYQVQVADGVHQVTYEGIGSMGVTAYGYACDVSYAYPGGLGGNP